jgi:hypothetical protein
MRKTPRHLSWASPVPFPPFDFDPPPPPRFTVLPVRQRDQTGEPRKIPVEHLPSPRCAILLKIVAMETYSANAPRLNRRRQFCDRFRAA